jgi:hypothetical protein
MFLNLVRISKKTRFMREWVSLVLFSTPIEGTKRLVAEDFCWGYVHLLWQNFTTGLFYKSLFDFKNKLFETNFLVDMISLWLFCRSLKSSSLQWTIIKVNGVAQRKDHFCKLLVQACFNHIMLHLWQNLAVVFTYFCYLVTLKNFPLVLLFSLTTCCMCWAFVIIYFFRNATHTGIVRL